MSKELDDALRDRQALISMAESEGWKVLCSKYAECFAELTNELFNPKTEKERAENLRQARAIIHATFSPHQLVTALLYRIDGVVKRDKPRSPPLSDQPVQ